MDRIILLLWGALLVAALWARGEETSVDRAALPVVEAVMTPVHVSENREKDLVKTDVDMAGSPRLKVTARVEGEALKDVRGWGHVRVAEAVDNTGKDLRPKAKKKPADKPEPRDADDADDDAAGFDDFTVLEPLTGSVDRDLLVEIGVRLPTRKARRLAHLRGDLLMLRGGEIKEVVIEHLQDQVGKPIDDAVLKEAGIEIHLSLDKRDDGSVNPEALTVKITGKAIAVASMDVRSDGGQSASPSSSFGTPNIDATAAERSFELDRPVDNTLSLKIHVMIGQTAVRVPFDFKDIPLP